MGMIIKGINKLKKKKNLLLAPVAPKCLTQEDLLTEIRDLLSKK